MNKINKLRDYQVKRDKLNKEIEEQFNIIMLEGYTMEERRIAFIKHKELIEEYLKFVKTIK